MPIPLPESVKKVLEDKAYGHVVTFNANGRPQVTMVWIDVEGNEALFNTAEGRKKPQNLKRDPRIMVKSLRCWISEAATHSMASAATQNGG